MIFLILITKNKKRNSLNESRASTKFENRGIKEGRKVYMFDYIKTKLESNWKYPQTF